MASGEQFAATNISAIAGMLDIWHTTKGDHRVLVAILDGDVDSSHPSLRDAKLFRLNTSTVEPSGTYANATHGTHVASIILGQHCCGVLGVAPNCHGLVAPIFRIGDNGEPLPCSQVELTRAITQVIEYADKNGYSCVVINISGGQLLATSEAHPLLSNVIQNADPSRVLFVAAAGNQGCECLNIPGAIPSVLAVGAMDDTGNPLDFSNWGASYREHGILAPGKNVLGAAIPSGTTHHSGTSFATAIVSGVAALLLSLQLKSRRPTNAKLVKEAIIASAQDCDHAPVDNCNKLLSGRLHIPGAISLLMGENYVTDNHSTPIFNSSESLQAAALSDAIAKTAEVPMSGVSIDRGTETSAGITPADCGCGGKSAPPSLVYVIGRLSFDYGTRARRAYFSNAFVSEDKSLQNIDSPRNLIKYLSADVANGKYTILDGKRFANRVDVTSIIWTLTIDETPIYAILPSDAFAFEVYDLLVEFLSDQVDQEDRIVAINNAIREQRKRTGGRKEKKSEDDWSGMTEISLDTARVSIAGTIIGTTRLFTGETVPVIRPDSRGMRNWTLRHLLGACQDPHSASEPPSLIEVQAARDLAEFLNLAYSKTRNLGISSVDRALNYAATDAFITQGIFMDVRTDPRFRGYEFDDFNIARSPICRPDADCWDVELYFYDPSELRRARRVIRYTIDVSDAVPVMVGRRQDFTAR